MQNNIISLHTLVNEVYCTDKDGGKTHLLHITVKDTSELNQDSIKDRKGIKKRTKNTNGKTNLGHKTRII